MRDRPTGELLILLIAGTVCFSVVATGAAITVVRIIRPEQDVSDAARAVADVLNTLIGMLAGYLAGRTDLMKRSADESREPPTGE